MIMITAKYDTSKIDKEKKLFESKNIIKSLFLVKLVPKVKEYFKFNYQFIAMDMIEKLKRNEGRDVKVNLQE